MCWALTLLYITGDQWFPATSKNTLLSELDRYTHTHTPSIDRYSFLPVYQVVTTLVCCKFSTCSVLYRQGVVININGSKLFKFYVFPMLCARSIIYSTYIYCTGYMHLLYGSILYTFKQQNKLHTLS